MLHNIRIIHFENQSNIIILYCQHKIGYHINVTFPQDKILKNVLFTQEKKGKTCNDSTRKVTGSCFVSCENVTI